jgi:endo-1,4-beta-xylanase
MKKFYISFTVFVFLLVSISFACSKKNTSTNYNIVTSGDTSLKQLPFPFGFAVNVAKLNRNLAYTNVLLTQAKSVTAETAMKIAYLHPAQNTYVWADADTLVNFATRNNIRVHGHTLIWHQSLPTWLTNFTGDSTAWENIMKTYIQTVVSHFKGKVASWDVVNEAIANDGTGYYRATSLWYQKLGPGYIARAFQYAHEADSSALLFYNDYGSEWSPQKRYVILDMLAGLKAKGVPIDGIGLQMHTDITKADTSIQNAIRTAAATGLKVHISELDISLNYYNDQSMVYNSVIAQKQSDKYKMLVKAYNAIPKSQQYGITTWEIGDIDSWITSFYNRPDWPLLFNNNYEKKAAFYGVLSGVQ